MGQEDFDKIIANKLSEQNTAAYSAAAWNGASSLLDQHFKKALYWRIAAVLIPLLFISGFGAYYLHQQNNASITEVPLPSSESQTAKPNNGNFTDLDSKEKINTNNVTISEDTRALTPSESATYHSEKSYLNLENVTAQVSNTASLQEDKTYPSTTNNASNPNEAIAAAVNLDKNVEPILSMKNGSQSQMMELDLMPKFLLNSLEKFHPHIVERSEKTPPTTSQFGKTTLSIELGGIVSNSLEGNATNGAPFGFGSLLGVNVSHYLASNTFISSGLLLNTRNALNSTFENKANFVLMEQKRITYLDIPIHIGFDANSRTRISLGLTFSPLISGYATSNTDRFDERSKAGFSTFDMAGSMQFGYQISPKIDLNARVRYGLFDLTDDKFFDSDNVDDRNHQLSISLSYRLLRR